MLKYPDTCIFSTHSADCVMLKNVKVNLQIGNLRSNLQTILYTMTIISKYINRNKQ